MRESKKFQVIIGGKERGTWSGLQYVSALVTKTRLMGVVALKIHWRQRTGVHFIQWFLLDAEEHGIAEYASVETLDLPLIDLHTERFMGGLGGKRVPLDQKEAIFLIKNFGRKNYVYNTALPQPSIQYNHLMKASVNLRDEEYSVLKRKICEEIDSPIQLINFFVMRAAANDIEGMTYLIAHEAVSIINNFRIVREASFLTKNEVSLIEKDGLTMYYLVKSIVDTEGEYFHIVSNIAVEKQGIEYKITKAQVIEREKILPEKVGEILQKKEYIRVYDLLVDTEEMVKKIYSVQKRVLRYDFPKGIMLVLFKKSNDHVRENIYYLSNDIQEIYFISYLKELMVCYYDISYEKRIEERFGGKEWEEFIQLSARLEVKNSIIYEYGQEGEVKFYDYAKKDLL